MSVSLENAFTPQVMIPFATGFVAVLVVTAILLLIRGSYRKSVSKSLSVILQEKEATKALLGGITETKHRLTDELSAARRIEFLTNEAATDRAALGDLKDRAALIVDRLDTVPAPKKLIPIAEQVADIAFLAEEELGKAINAGGGAEVYDALMQVDSEKLTLQLEVAERDLNDLAVYYGITEVAIYKGGLYV